MDNQKTEVIYSRTSPGVQAVTVFRNQQQTEARAAWIAGAKALISYVESHDDVEIGDWRYAPLRVKVDTSVSRQEYRQITADDVSRKRTVCTGYSNYQALGAETDITEAWREEANRSRIADLQAEHGLYAVEIKPDTEGLYHVATVDDIDKRGYVINYTLASEYNTAKARAIGLAARAISHGVAIDEVDADGKPIVEKFSNSWEFGVLRKFGIHGLAAEQSHEGVCEKVVTGKKAVSKVDESDPNVVELRKREAELKKALAEAPKIETEEEETEWVCPPSIIALAER